MFLTTHFMTLVLLTIWRLPLPFVVGWYALFAPIEATYLSATFEKIPTGKSPLVHRKCFTNSPVCELLLCLNSFSSGG
jgi:K+ transporter